MGWWTGMVKVFTSFGPYSPEEKRVILGTFKGVDLTSGAASVDPARSPDAPNMMPDANGFPVKRPGFALMEQYPAPVYGVYRFRASYAGADALLVHSGKWLFVYGQPLYRQDGELNCLADDMNQAPSMALQRGERLWVLDGKTYRYISFTQKGEKVEYKVAPVTEIATVPVITIAKGPSRDSAATSYNPINLLTDTVTEQFLVEEKDAAATDFYLSYGVERIEKVEVLDQKGLWQTQSEGGYTFLNDPPVLKFTEAPGKTPVTGEDNVRVTYTRPATGNAQKINRMRFGILYGVRGALDRVFLSGSPDEPNLDYWSQYDDPAYFGDTMYSVLGTEASPIMGYSILNEKLVTHKKWEENDRNAFVRYGQLDEDGDAEFIISGVIQGPGCVSPYANASMSSEPVFLTADGLFAFTASDLTGERYKQERSYYIRGALEKQELTGCRGCVWGRYYVIAAPDGLYLVDGAQKSYESRAGQSSFQYECYYWPQIRAGCVWEADGSFMKSQGGLNGQSGAETWDPDSVLMYADETGGVWALQAADGSRIHYQDYGAPDPDGNRQGRAVRAYWTTPVMPLSEYGRLKNIQEVWVSCQPYGHSRGLVSYGDDKNWQLDVKEWDVARFAFDDIDWADWTFETLDRPYTVRCGQKLYNVQVLQVKVGNSDETPFGLYAIQVDFSLGVKVRV